MGFLRFPYMGCLWGTAWRLFGPPELRYKLTHLDFAFRVQNQNYSRNFQLYDLANYRKRKLKSKLKG